MQKIFLFLILLFSWKGFGAHQSQSIYAVDGQGSVILDQNSELSLVPASTMKLVTTAAALEILGPDFCFETKLEYDGQIVDGVLKGNLYIKGGGDPTLGSERLAQRWQETIHIWVKAIQNLKIQAIEGKVITDATCFENQRAHPSWQMEDVGNYYGAGASGLSFHENAYALFFKSGKNVGDRTTILRMVPPMQLHTVDNEVMTGEKGSGDRACIYGSEFSWHQVARGTIPLGDEEFMIKGAIPDPTVLCQELLEKALHDQGIVIKNGSWQKGKRQVCHTTYSPRLIDIVQATNQKSINLYAEHLFKKLGGASAIKKFWASKGIDLSGFNMEDGCGLSRKNLMTAKQLVMILKYMKNSPHYSSFFASLNTGVKTGSMSLVRSLAGYKGDITFAILINNSLNSKEMNENITSLFEKL